MVLHPSIVRIAEEVPSLLVNGWFLDDGAQIGKTADLIKGVHFLVQDGPAMEVTCSTTTTTPRNKELKSSS